MKNFMITCVVAVAVFGLVQVGSGSPAPVQGGQERLENSLRRKLSPLVGVFDNLSFKLDTDRTVTLYGQVREPRVKDHAEEDAKEVEGVGRIVNQIEVLPLSSADDDLRIALYWAIYRQTGLSRYALQVRPPIHIIVRNGHVALEGVVGSSSESSQAALAANGVSGVFSVKNNLRVEGSD
jgi:hyperosmotically inducible protein